ncbi:MAG: fumarate reductase/succinate dehydrogenase flavoprotein subunit, partial [Muribaculaceae bacterium]|nr:fumarate reductase/succinate dehydrogenase flavoprotein subunit [Muribaculaceae bacterium]
LQNYLSDQIKVPHFKTNAPEFAQAEADVKARIEKLMNIKGTKSPDEIHKRLGRVMWDLVGMGRTLQSIVKATKEIEEVRKEFYSDLRVVGAADDLNTELEKALRLEDFLVMAKMMAIDALNRNESCGAHFREEYQTADGEAARNDEEYMYVSCWKYTGENEKPILLKEPLKYEAIQVQTRNYKS